MQKDLSERCVEQDRDEAWTLCKPKGIFTRLPEFELVPRWDFVAQQVRAKFDGFLDLTKPLMPPIALYALEKDANASCKEPWTWFKDYQSQQCAKAQSSKKRTAGDHDGNNKTASKRSCPEKQSSHHSQTGETPCRGASHGCTSAFQETQSGY
jgi:hypothetical protein